MTVHYGRSPKLTTPPVADDAPPTAAEVAAARIRAAAVSALTDAGCTSVELLRPTLEARLCYHAGQVAALDEDSSVRYGVTPYDAAVELRKEHGRYFRR